MRINISLLQKKKGYHIEEISINFADGLKDILLVIDLYRS